MKKITVSAPAKINLYLEVLDRLDNGYHNIETIMQTVSLADTITVENNDIGTLKFFCSDPALPKDSSNIAYAAAEIFFDTFNISDRGVTVSIEKRIPVAAGLAGGSTDAAAVLIALNDFYNCGADTDKLCNIGAKLGADVPFCIKKGTIFACGIGNKFIPCGLLPDCHIVVAVGQNRVSTKWAYEQLDIRARELKSITPMLKALDIGDMNIISQKLYNIFEILSPEASKIKQKMLELGAVGSIMSGSGPAVFGIFQNKSNAENAKKLFSENGYASFVCMPVTSK